MSQKRRHNSRRYRSGLEKTVAAFLKDNQTRVRYEVLKIEWEDLRYRTYTPDFILDNGIIIETKGIFDSEDRRKHMEIRKQHPELDIRFVFSNSMAKFLWAHRVIPEAWLKEKGRPTRKKFIAFKGSKRKT